MSIQDHAISPTDSVLPAQASLTCSDAERIRQANLINVALNSLKQDILVSMQEENGRIDLSSHKKDCIAKIEKIKAEHHVTTEELLRVANLAIEENQKRCPSACRHYYRHSMISKSTKQITFKNMLFIVLIILLLILSMLLMAIYIKHTSIHHRQQFLKEKPNFIFS